MELIPWILLGILLLEHIVFLPALFERAGLNKTHGFIPGLNYWMWLKAIGRPWYWLILLVIPGVNLIMLVIMHVELGINFGERSTVDQWKQGALPWVFLPVLSRSGFKYVGKRDWTNIKKSTGREWGESILWALVVATVVRTFIFEAFMIPTGSMEGSMLVGDYLYVSKTSYGPKVPQTPFSVPLIHNALPGSMVPSYTEEGLPSRTHAFQAFARWNATMPWCSTFPTATPLWSIRNGLGTITTPSCAWRPSNAPVETLRRM